MPMERVPASKAFSRTEFHQQLRQWLANTSDAQIGGEDVPGVTAWIYVEHFGDNYRLHADTKREAVEEYLKLVALYGEELEWSVVANKRGNENAVVHGPDQKRVTSFYLYLT